MTGHSGIHNDLLQQVRTDVQSQENSILEFCTELKGVGLTQAAISPVQTQLPSLVAAARERHQRLTRAVRAEEQLKIGLALIGSFVDDAGLRVIF